MKLDPILCGLTGFKKIANILKRDWPLNKIGAVNKIIYQKRCLGLRTLKVLSAT